MTGICVLEAFYSGLESQWSDLLQLLDISSDIDRTQIWLLAPCNYNVEKLPFGGKIKLLESPDGVTETLLSVLTAQWDKERPKLLLFPSGDFAASLAVRLAFRLKGKACTSGQGLTADGNGLLVKRPSYGANMLAELRMDGGPACIAAAKAVSAPSEVRASSPVEVETISPPPGCGEHPWIVSREEEAVPRQDGLESAKVLLAVGRGAGNEENVLQHRESAHLLGAKLGASRPVVMSAWSPMDTLVGASGTVTAPQVCIAAGVSGVAAFSVGIEKSAFIAAINQDKKAPIFRMADVGVVGDCNEILPALCRCVQADRDRGKAGG